MYRSCYSQELKIMFLIMLCHNHKTVLLSCSNCCNQICHMIGKIIYYYLWTPAWDLIHWIIPKRLNRSIIDWPCLWLYINFKLIYLANVNTDPLGCLRIAENVWLYILLITTSCIFVHVLSNEDIKSLIML